MARIFIDGFEAQSFDLWEGGPGTNEIVTTESVGFGSGNYCAYFPEGQGVSKYLPDNSKYVIAFRFSITNYLNIRFWNGAALQGWVQIARNSDEIAVHNSLETGSFEAVYSYDYGTCNKHLQISFENVDATNKRVIIKLDRLEIGDCSFANSSPDFGTTNVISIQSPSSVFFEPRSWLDDIVIDDADWPDESEIYGMAPSANGTTIEWTPSSGENYQAVRETPPTTDDYVESITPGAIDIFETVSPLSGGETVRSVQAQYYVSSGAYLQPCFYSGETFHYGSDVSGETLRHFTVCQIWDSNPMTSGEWGITDIEEMQTGMRLA